MSTGLSTLFGNYNNETTMVQTTVSRLGAIEGGDNTAADANTALMLKVFSGEVLKVFDEKQVAKDMVRTRRISGAKEAQFPIMGVASAGYHLPGSDLSDPATGLLSEIEHNERVIKIDYPLVSPVFISEFDEALNHYETRAEYAHQLGESLANTWDRLLLRVLSSCGTAVAAVEGEAPGSIVTLGGSGNPTVTHFIDAVFEAKQKFDENDTPLAERFLIIPPAWEIALIRSDDKLIDRDYSPSNGSYAAATVGRMAGMTIVTSNHVPSGALTVTNSSGLKGSDYNISSTTVYSALAVQKQAIGSVSLWDMEVQHQYSALHQGTFLIARIACGAGVLKPSCCIPIVGEQAPA